MTAIGALTGLFLSIFLILKKINPAYSLILGALVGGLLGGLSIVETTTFMVTGIKDISPAIIRILTAGVLSGVLIKTGAAARIAYSIINKLGESRALIALVLATMILTAVGVFIDVAVITVSPIAIVLAQKMDYSKGHILIAMIGGGKCGNIISPNPNTIIASENMGADLSSVMVANLIPAILGALFVIWLVMHFSNKGERVTEAESQDLSSLPSFAASITGPVVTIIFLAVRPLFGISIDPLVALPAGGLAGYLAAREKASLSVCLDYGLGKMAGVSILLVATGTIAGIIKNSTLKDLILSGLSQLSISESLIAPVSGALMSAVTASSTAGSALASASFSNAILAAGIPAIWGAALINSSATMFDHLPHGSFFHATAGAVGMNLKERLRLIIYESLVGTVLTIFSFIAYLVMH